MQPARVQVGEHSVEMRPFAIRAVVNVTQHCAEPRSCCSPCYLPISQAFPCSNPVPAHPTTIHGVVLRSTAARSCVTNWCCREPGWEGVSESSTKKCTLPTCNPNPMARACRQWKCLLHGCTCCRGPFVKAAQEQVVRLGAQRSAVLAGRLSH